MASFFILTPHRFSRNFHFSYYIASIAELSTAIQENARHHLGDAGHFYAFNRSAATATTAIRHAAAIVAITVIRQQDQHDDEQQPGAVTAAKQVPQTHMVSPPPSDMLGTRPPKNGTRLSNRSRNRCPGHNRSHHYRTGEGE